MSLFLANICWKYATLIEGSFTDGASARLPNNCSYVNVSDFKVGVVGLDKASLVLILASWIIAFVLCARENDIALEVTIPLPIIRESKCFFFKCFIYPPQLLVVIIIPK